MCDERKSLTSCDGELWGSNYGTGIDVVAPGVLISTTDRQGNNGYNPNTPIHPLSGGSLVTSDYPDKSYTIWFNGTSAACPHVSGVAALIISMNPTLTNEQIRCIIASTAKKVGSYVYTINTGHISNLSWNNEMGYGLLDAHKALVSVSSSITGASTICTSGTYTLTNLPTGATVMWSVTPSSVATVSGSGSSITVTRVGSANNNITLLANVNSGCGVITLKKDILVGAPLATLLNVTGDFTTNVGDEASFQANYNGVGLCRSTSGGIIEVQWTVDPSSGPVDIDDTDSRYCRLALTPGAGATLEFSTSGTKWLTVRAKNACGWSAYANFYINVLP
jgi:subtilisin family serine protease